MLNKKKITVIFIVFLAVIFLLPHLSFAQDAYGINDLTSTNLGTRELRDTIAGIINIFLGFLGILATLIILYGGYIWMTSGGNPDKVGRAKKIIINGVIGLVIILSSYAIARFILGRAQNGFFGPNGNSGYNGYSGGIGLGGSVLESHYPARNARDIARNTNIYITFKEPMRISDFIINTGCNHVDLDYSECLDDDYIKLIDDNDVEVSGLDMMVRYDDENKVFEINPYGNDPNEHLGNPNGAVNYKVVLLDLYTANDREAFPFTGYYDWSFTVSNELDLVPPRVTSVVPQDGSVGNPRNSAVQINFSEAVNPLFAAGVYPDFDNITIRDSGGTILSGSYLISNQYRTIEFITDELCGMNSCGGEVYCLPGDQSLDANVTDLIRDMSGNQLDSNGNGTGGEGLVDNYAWSFATNNTIDLTPPEIISMDSGTDLPINDPIQAVFSKNLLASSINSDNINLVKVLPDNSTESINYWLRLLNNNIVSVEHDNFDTLSNYSPTFSSGIQDIMQNCWYPCVCDDPGGSCSCDEPPCSGNHCEGN